MDDTADGRTNRRTEEKLLSARQKINIRSEVIFLDLT